jgi:hypothetical protein
MDDKVVVGIETFRRITSTVDTEGECTPHWSWVDLGPASITEGPGREILFMCLFRSMESSSMAACMFFVSVGSHRASRRRCWTMLRWLGTRYLGGFAGIPMAERDISANACHRPYGVSRTWRRWPIQRGAPSGTQVTQKCAPQWISAIKRGAILSSSCPSLWFQVVANEVFCGSCGHIPHVCRNGQW